MKVLFLGGTGRTGSTLLERLLGQSDGVFAGGEMTFLWYALAGEGRCSCRRLLRECPVWAPVVEAALAPSDLSPADLVALRNRYRSVHLPLTAAGGLHRRMLERLGPYREVVGRTYEALHAQTGSRLIVDASKEPHYSAILDSLDALDVYFLHLVRDPRAVAHSWRREMVHGGFGPEYDMPRRNLLTSAVYYGVSNLAAEAIWRSRPERYLRIRYEDLMADPEATLARVGRFVDEPVDTSFLDGRTAAIGPLHTAWGNPNRFEGGPTELRLDDQWRSTMPHWRRRASGALNAPWLHHYGYRGEGSASTGSVAG